MACASHDGAIGAETPQKRRGGPPDGMPGCEKHVHNFDHPSWQMFINATGATIIVGDQCPFLDREEDATKTGPKATAYLVTPNILEDASELWWRSGGFGSGQGSSCTFGPLYASDRP